MRTYRSRYNNDPRETIARFDSTCPETGKPIRKGDPIVYFPNGKKAFHTESKTAEGWRLQAAADAFGLMDANW
jgi:hypothetical protein